MQSVLDRPIASTGDGIRSAHVDSPPVFSGSVFCEAELKEMRAALADLSTRFGIAQDSPEYQSAAVAIVRIAGAGAGPIDAGGLAELACSELALTQTHER